MLCPGRGGTPDDKSEALLCSTLGLHQCNVLILNSIPRLFALRKSHATTHRAFFLPPCFFFFLIFGLKARLARLSLARAWPARPACAEGRLVVQANGT